MIMCNWRQYNAIRAKLSKELENVDTHWVYNLLSTDPCRLVSGDTPTCILILNFKGRMDSEKRFKLANKSG